MQFVQVVEVLRLQVIPQQWLILQNVHSVVVIKSQVLQCLIFENAVSEEDGNPEFKAGQLEPTELDVECASELLSDVVAASQSKADVLVIYFLKILLRF